MKYYYDFKKIVIYIIPLIITGIVCHYLFIKTTPNYIKHYQQTIDSAQYNNDILKGEIVKSYIAIDSLHKEIVVLDSVNIVLKDRIVYIKQKADEKINGVDLLTNDELGKFFTERYKYQR
jgi:hypothetical protein